ncbi:MAG: protein TolR [Thermodesulfobacteriota bacterium]|jgi:biopolymer transport protein TolR|nr:MAG: protein TolR [Thermodesulfobacteriota bacterium]
MNVNGNKNDHRMLSEINVTPFVDVMLVLLVIFMVTAPMMQSGFDVDLPQVKAKTIQTNEKPLIVTISKDKKIEILDYEFTLDRLKSKLEFISQGRADKEIYLKADKTVPYGFVMEVMAEIKDAGYEKLGMITLPLEEKGK